MTLPDPMSTLFPYTTLFRSKGDASRDVGLDQTSDDINRRALGSQEQVNTDGTSHLSNTGDSFFSLGRSEQHKIGQLVDHDHYVRSEEHTSELQSRENLVCRL